MFAPEPTSLMMQYLVSRFIKKDHKYRRILLSCIYTLEGFLPIVIVDYLMSLFFLEALILSPILVMILEILAELVYLSLLS